MAKTLFILVLEVPWLTTTLHGRVKIDLNNPMKIRVICPFVQTT